MSGRDDDDRSGWGQRRALTNVGGRARFTGDPSARRRLEVASRPAPDFDARALTHGFHTWPARMHPWTAGHLVEAAPPGGAILDPFMGGGTVLVEAMLAGRVSFGRDVNPVALEVAWARTRIWGRTRREAFVEAGRAVVDAAREIRGEERPPDELWRTEKEWYDAPAFVELWSLLKAASKVEDPGLARMLRVVVSSLIVKASRQASDTVRKQDRAHRFVPKRRVEQWFTRRVDELAGQLEQVLLTMPKIPDARKGEVRPRVRLADARWPDDSLRKSVAAVITSPPYPGVYDYIDHQRRRYSLLDLDASLASRAEIGRRKQVEKRGWEEGSQSFEADLGKAMAAWRAALIDEGRVWLVIGDGQHSGGTIPALPLVQGAAHRGGLRVLAALSQPRPVFKGTARPTERKEEHLVELAIDHQRNAPRGKGKGKDKGRS